MVPIKFYLRRRTLLVYEANKRAADRFLKAHPILTGVQPASKVISAMTKKTILHAGPPLSFAKMCDVQRAAIIGGAIFEGLAKDGEEAKLKLEGGEIQLKAALDAAVVAGGTGVTTASMPVVEVRDKTFRNKSFHFLFEGFGKTLIFGAYDEQVRDRLDWFRRSLGPALNSAIKTLGGIDVKAIMTEALLRGDELHNRNKAATSMLNEIIAQGLIKAKLPSKEILKIIDFLRETYQFFVCITMPAVHVTLKAADGIVNSTVVTAMVGNGVDIGLKISGKKNMWFTAPSTFAKGKTFPGYSEEDANPFIGDSGIVETGGLGAFALAAAPACAEFLGYTARDARQFTSEMYQITVTEHNEWKIPALDYRGTPSCIDARKVVRTGILPVIDAAICHKKPGVGMIGAGILRPPMKCFERALESMDM